MIRRATGGDAPAIAVLHVRSWAHAYADFVAVDDMPTLDERRAQWEGLLAGEHDVRVLEAGGRLAGVAATAPAQDEAATPATAELRLIYVDPAAQGAGVGSALLADAERRLGDRGFARATLWVYAANGLARRFYERRGWSTDGGEDVYRGAPCVRYAKALGQGH